MNEKDFETVMEAVCDICHWPFVEKSEEALNVHCEDCPVEKVLREMGRTREMEKDRQAREAIERLRRSLRKSKKEGKRI